MTNYLDLDYLKSLNKSPAWFGLGFIQLKLNDYERLHFYHPDMHSEMNNEEVHDHRYSFLSTVLKGELRNEIYYFEPETNGQYIKEQVSCDSNNPIIDSDLIYGNLFHLFTSTTIQDNVYAIEKNTLHRVSTISYPDTVITLVTREYPYSKQYANIVRNKNFPRKCPFETKLEDRLLWRLIEECIYSGYHVRSFPRGKFGELSKILEEFEELYDATMQKNKIMIQVELSDLYLAMEGFLQSKFSDITMEDIKEMANATRRSFELGERNPH